MEIENTPAPVVAASMIARYGHPRALAAAYTRSASASTESSAGLWARIGEEIAKLAPADDARGLAA